MLIVNAEVAGQPGFRIRAGSRIEAIAADLKPAPGEEVYDAAGGAVIAGLHDHHIHLRATLAARSSVRLTASFDAHRMGAAIAAAAAAADTGQWLRVVGYQTRRMGPLDRDGLDRLAGSNPVRVQSSTGELWVLNSAALRVCGLETAADAGIERDPSGRATGRLWRMDDRLRHAIGAGAGGGAGPVDEATWAALSRSAAAQGVTGFTDATVGRDQDDIDAFAELVARGVIRQHLTLMSPAGSRTRPGLTLGPHKIVLDDVTLPTGDELARVIQAAHELGSAVAVHCVTLDQLVLTLAALEQAGPQAADRIEHASVVAPVVIDAIRALGVTVVTQPGFVRERGDDYLRDVSGPEQAWLYPCATLLAAGVPVAAGTDAPHSSSNPWPGIAAAIDRRTSNGAILGAGERVDGRRALELFLGAASRPGHRRRVRPGAPGQLCLLRGPLRGVLADPCADAVAGSVIDGRLTSADGDDTGAVQRGASKP